VESAKSTFEVAWQAKRSAAAALLEDLVDESNDRILAFTMIFASTGEAMAALQMAVFAGLPFARLFEAAFTHPTMAEGLGPPFPHHTLPEAMPNVAVLMY
jgi:pyruvate/2-oxoglutarate dehydrogenase complex dihydrolipoamide dehydrogenase (E3) component